MLEFLIEEARIVGYWSARYFIARIVMEAITLPSISEQETVMILVLFHEWRYEYKSYYKKMLHNRIVKLWASVLKSA